ncbi:uncharacterized protein B0H18DRAFT_1012231 [Fomitopsis serialis]|uniref:uncharacterized protein n=1 Tax=Fomitopsis serialis TaxID=139415 RepID=UPI0020083085|nr:uncharacterized protein B0H18DRAFT_1012231 [Neoantrodia serialis]KAH9924446.1 hypothetical protein B0H18DRAFT_1012231 [Neoantrodia serialis]
MRNCGFIFTFPDPDSPDMLIMDDDENVGVLVDLDADEEPPLMAQHASQPAILSQPSTSSARPGTTRSRRESPQRRPRTGSVESSEEDDYNSDVHDDGDKSVARPPTASSSTRGKGKGKGPPPRRPRASAPAASAARSSLDAVSAAFVDGMQGGDPDPDMDEDNDANAWMDALLLPRSKGKAPARGRPGRPRGSGTRGRPARNASSRRKTTHLAVAHASGSSSIHASAPVRAPEPMRLPSPLGARAQAQASGSSRAAQPRDERPLPLFFPSPSPPAPTPGRKRARSLHADDVIEIESSDDERPSLPAPKRRPRYARASDPSSSQPSRLSDTGYLRDAEVIIDLTV